jgi:tetratricopeptide (TPR) repeat protein
LPECDLHIELAGLSVADVERLWRAAGHAPSSEESKQLHTYTGGNPRLITLILTLHDGAKDVATSLDSNDAAKSLLPAFQRLWRRLVPEERRALQRLSVYQGYAPESLLPTPMLNALVGLHLVEPDVEGGIALLPAFSTIVYDELSPELREKLHGEAAIVRLERGEYTAAAYHFARSNQESRAVQVWFPQRQHAIARGEADAARQIFGNISRQRLDRQERKALDVVRAELRQMAGQREEALRELEQADWSDQSEATSRLWMLRGEMQEALGYPDRALESYADGLQVTARLLGQLAALRLRRGLLFQHRRDHRASWQEIYRAEFELGVMRGLMREEEGAYQEALESYQRCRALAEQLDDDSLRAQAERWIAALHGRRQQLDEAVAHGMQAIAIYERLGDRVNLEKMRSNMAFIYVQTRQFRQALEVGALAYAFFTAVRDPYFAGYTGNNLAEASFELGDLDAAARYAGEILSLGHRSTVPYARFTLGQIDLAHGNVTSAIDNFTDSLQIAQSNDDPYLVAYAERALGEAYLAAANVGAAEQHLQSALSLFRQLDIPGEITTTEHLLVGVQAR